MLSKEMLNLGSKRSVIRDIFEYGRERAKTHGADSVFDFSLGNPSVPAPSIVDKEIFNVINTVPTTKVHGYTSAPGFDEARDAIANNLNRRFGTNYDKNAIYITHGAAMTLTGTIKALTVNSDSEFIAFAPCFPEYDVFARVGGGSLRVVKADEPDFQINFDEFLSTLNTNTQGVIINSPNNPSGVVYIRETIIKLAKILTEKSAEYGHPIYLISDEPYRELVYDGVEVPFVPNFYCDTILCYSYSKSLSLPGERIGYVLMPQSLTEMEDVRFAIPGALRALGAVCASSMMQLVIARCSDHDVAPNLDPYIENRDLLCEELGKMGYTFTRPQGAFYLFMKAPGGDAVAFCEKAKELGILAVPGDGFYCSGWLRMSYCVDNAMIKRSLPAFAKLIEQYK